MTEKRGGIKIQVERIDILPQFTPAVFSKCTFGKVMKKKGNIKIRVERMNKLPQLTPPLIFNRFISKSDGTKREH